MKTQASPTVQEGKTAAVLGSKRSDNPYTKAKNSMMASNNYYDDNRYDCLMDLECQWDSGFSQGKYYENINCGNKANTNYEHKWKPLTAQEAKKLEKRLDWKEAKKLKEMEIN